MSVRKRTWVTKSGEAREAWICNYSDAAGVRWVATFERKREADVYEAETRTAIRPARTRLTARARRSPKPACFG